MTVWESQEAYGEVRRVRTVPMDAQPTTYRPLMVHRGRHFGWWVEGRKSNGRRYMWTWWPTKGIASLVARTWVAMLRRLGRAATPIEIEETDQSSSAH